MLKYKQVVLGKHGFNSSDIPVDKILMAGLKGKLFFFSLPCFSPLFVFVTRFINTTVQP